MISSFDLVFLITLWKETLDKEAQYTIPLSLSLRNRWFRSCMVSNFSNSLCSLRGQPRPRQLSTQWVRRLLGCECEFAMIPCGSWHKKMGQPVVTLSSCVTAVCWLVWGIDLRLLVNVSEGCTFEFRFCPQFLSSFTLLLFKLQTSVQVRSLKECMCSLASLFVFLGCSQPSLCYAFLDNENWFLVFDLMSGGDFRCECTEQHNNHL